MVKTVSFQIFNNRLFLSSKSANACDLIGALTKCITIRVKNNVSLKQVAEKLGFDSKTGFKSGRYASKMYINNSNNTMLIIHFV